MIRLVIGSILGGLAQFVVGFLFWATPLSAIAFKVATDQQNADVQAALARTLAPLGAGTFFVPWPDTPAGTVMMGRGPVALIHFNPAGFPLMSNGALIGGLVLSIATVWLLGLALYMIAGRVADFATRARVVVLASLAATLYLTIGQPVFNFYLPWTYWVYLAVSQLAGLVAGGLVVARWFLPRPVVSSAVE